MSETDPSKNRADTQFDTMDTGALEQLLHREDMLPDGTKANTDRLLAILEVMEKREQEQTSGQAIDVDKAWEVFNTCYRPTQKDAGPLYDGEDPEEEPERPCKAVPAAPPRPKRRGYARLFRGSAAVAAVLLIATLTAYAGGFDPWGAIAIWGRETFRITSIADTATSSAAAPAEVPEQLAQLKKTLEEHGVTAAVLPTYLPEGYEVEEASCAEQTIYTMIFCALSRGNDHITLSYVIHFSDPQSEYQKDEGNPELYTAGETTYNIMSNAGKYFCVWLIDNLECSICGLNSREELIRIIDSIGG